MEKFIIDKDEFQLYYLMMISDDLLLVKEGVQKLSDFFANRRHILNSDKSRFLNILEKLLSDKQYIHIHKWIYKCTCFYCNSTIEEICKKNFFLTEDMDTRNWIISTIASMCYNKKEFQDKINAMCKFAITEQQLESLDSKNVFYNASIFGHFEIKYTWKNISNTIIKENDRNGMYWMAKLFAYYELTRKRNIEHLIKKEELDILTYSNDKEVQTYAYWGMVHQVDGKLSLIQEEHKHNIKSNDSLKWYYSGIIQGEYANHNFEFIEEVLKSTCEKFKNNSRAKEGIVNGINSIPYESRFDSNIIDWYYEENSKKVKIKLLEYMIKNVNKNSKNEHKFSSFGSFFTVIQDECLDIDIVDYIKHYIKIYKTLTINNEKEKLVIDINKEEKNMSKNSINGGNFYGPVIFENKGNVIQKEEKELLLKLLDDFEKVCNQQGLLKECQEVQNCVESNASDMKSKLMAFESRLANFITLVTGTPQVVSIGKSLLEYIKQLSWN